jgi:hypothetical protein
MDLEYERFLQDLTEGKVVLEEFLPPEFSRMEEIQSISSMVESWNQPINQRKKEIQEFESLMDPLLIDYMNSMTLNLTESEITKIEIYDLIYSVVKKFQYIQDAKKFLVDTKYTKNELSIIASAMGVDTSSKKLSNRFRIIDSILDLFDDIDLRQKPKRKKTKKNTDN